MNEKSLLYNYLEATEQILTTVMSHVSKMKNFEKENIEQKNKVEQTDSVDYDSESEKKNNKKIEIDIFCLEKQTEKIIDNIQHLEKQMNLLSSQVDNSMQQYNIVWDSNRLTNEENKRLKEKICKLEKMIIALDIRIDNRFDLNLELSESTQKILKKL